MAKWVILILIFCVLAQSTWPAIVALLIYGAAKFVGWVLRHCKGILRAIVHKAVETANKANNYMKSVAVPNSKPLVQKKSKVNMNKSSGASTDESSDKYQDVMPVSNLTIPTPNRQGLNTRASTKHLSTALKHRGFDWKKIRNMLVAFGGWTLNKIKIISNSTWFVVALLILLPLIGLVYAMWRRPAWFKNIPFVAASSFYTLFFVGSVAYNVCQPEVFYESYYEEPKTIAHNRNTKSSQETRADIPSATDTHFAPYVNQTPVVNDTPNTTVKTENSTQSAPNNTAAADPMSGIAVAEDNNAPYDRKQYQPTWSVGVGCDIRSRMLASTSTAAVQFGSNGCTVKWGQWKDMYTGQVLTGNPYRGDGTANDLDIDHIIPLHYVNNHGGSNWSSDQKRSYGASLDAMNKGVYIAVSASENRRKGDQGPASYYPPNPEYRCEYSRRWRDIARAYGIAMSQADFNVVRDTLNSCGIK